VALPAGEADVLVGPSAPPSTVDNYGNAEAHRGHIDGDRLVFESIADTGTRLRLTWDASDAAVIRWRNEMTAGDGSWFLIEE
jgi:hypothetical protein